MRWIASLADGYCGGRLCRGASARWSVSAPPSLLARQARVSIRRGAMAMQSNAVATCMEQYAPNLRQRRARKQADDWEEKVGDDGDEQDTHSDAPKQVRGLL